MIAAITNRDLKASYEVDIPFANKLDCVLKFDAKLYLRYSVIAKHKAVGSIKYRKRFSAELSRHVGDRRWRRGQVNVFLEDDEMFVHIIAELWILRMSESANRSGVEEAYLQVDQGIERCQLFRDF